MEKKTKRNIIITGVLFILFILLVVLVKCVDKSTTIDGVTVGLFSINSQFLKDTANSMMDKISDVCLYFSFLVFASVAGLGLYQLIKRKSLKKVDISIYIYACVSILVVIAYVLFDKVIINYRPILIDGKKEASFPSSHVLMATYFTFGASYVYSKIFKNKEVIWSCYIISGTISLITFLGRMMSLNHWLTDCLAGLLLAFAFFALLITLTQIFTKKEIKE